MTSLSLSARIAMAEPARMASAPRAAMDWTKAAVARPGRRSNQSLTRI
jgi:hypothetical protein